MEKNKKRTYTTKEISELSGQTPRTLYFYEQEGLLSPERNPRNDYRIYSEENIDRLQQILYLREIDLSLKDIYGLLVVRKNTPQQIFTQHRKTILAQRDKLNHLL